MNSSLSGRFYTFGLIGVLALLRSSDPANAYSGNRVTLAGSVAEVSRYPHARVVRTKITDAERAQVLRFVVSLRMPNFAELQERLSHAAQFSHDTMEARYLPSRADYLASSDWFVSQGFTVTQADPNHTNIFLSGTIGQIEATLGVSFARVRTSDGEFTSAITAPSIPSELAGATLAISGLQPHLRAHHQNSVRPQVIQEPGVIYAAPSDILAAYNCPATLTGAGQTIAVIGDVSVPTSDLATFYSTVGSAQTVSNFTQIIVGSTNTPDETEGAMDVEWASGMAPGAATRLYSVIELTDSNLLAALAQILADAPSKHITVLSMSFGNGENTYANGSIQAYSQAYARLTAAGITCCAASGDGGSNPSPLTKGYDSSSPLQTVYPASDQSVTAVGATILYFTSAYGYASERVWEEGWPSGNVYVGPAIYSSGGGYSYAFGRPAWQTDGGSILGNTVRRGVPDVSIFCQGPPDKGGLPTPLVIYNGQITAGGGTSIASPIFAGIVALLNQARANNGLGPIGLLGPKIYPLHGTAAFNDITVGTNGAYSAGPGYDLCTGLGSPNIAALAVGVGGTILSAAPEITSEPNSQTIATGATVVLTAGAQPSWTIPPYSTAPISYQWSMNGTMVSGATNSSLMITNTSAANQGSYTCAISNVYGSVTTSPATVTVQATANPGRLINLSVLTPIPAGNNMLTVGFVTGGAGTTGSQSLLIRATGPTLAQFLQPGVVAMPDPQLAVFDPSRTVIASNSAWASTPANQAAVSAADTATYAFTLTDPKSKDSAIALPLPLNNYGYTVQVTSVSQTAGTTLAEVYDNTPVGTYTATTPRLINISCKQQVAANGSLTEGFWIGGTTAKTVLIRAGGPALAPYVAAGVTLMPDPQLKVFNAADQVIAANSGWGGNPQIAAAATAVYAYAFTNPASTDSAVLITLPPGGYTAQASSVSGSAGTALVEVYEVP